MINLFTIEQSTSISKNLREKLGKAGNMIKTIRGIGYKLEGD